MWVHPDPPRFPSSSHLLGGRWCWALTCGQVEGRDAWRGWLQVLCERFQAQLPTVTRDFLDRRQIQLPFSGLRSQHPN